MRITRNDKLINVYSVNSTITAEGYKTESYVAVYSGIGVDIQPVSGKIDVTLYGIDKNPAMAKNMFFDSDKTIRIGDLVKVVSTGEVYMVKSLNEWYSHKEAILDLREVTVP
jgi:hypothetical protein